MSPGKTTTGAVLEKMILPALQHGNYSYQTQVEVGRRLGGRRHIVDVVATGVDGTKYLIALKWQQVSGTAEQKVPFEVMCLVKAIRCSHGRYQRAYLVLGGPGWSLRDFFVRGGLKRYLKHCDAVRIVPMETFIRLANQGSL